MLSSNRSHPFKPAARGCHSLFPATLRLRHRSPGCLCPRLRTPRARDEATPSNGALIPARMQSKHNRVGEKLQRLSLRDAQIASVNNRFDKLTHSSLLERSNICLLWVRLGKIYVNFQKCSRNFSPANNISAEIP